MSRQVTLPAGTAASLTFKARYNIETGLRLRLRRGRRRHRLRTIPGQRSPTDRPECNGITGLTDGWVGRHVRSDRLRRARRSGCASGTPPTAAFRVTIPTGPPASSSTTWLLTVDGATVLADDAESGANGWTPDGSPLSVPRSPRQYDNYYIAGWRTYTSYDKYLKTGPYNFGCANTQAGPGGALRLPAGSVDLLLGHSRRPTTTSTCTRVGSQPLHRRAPEDASGGWTEPPGGPGSRSTMHRSA